jgi:uncharacterized membrane protein
MSLCLLFLPFLSAPAAAAAAVCCCSFGSPPADPTAAAAAKHATQQQQQQHTDALRQGTHTRVRTGEEGREQRRSALESLCGPTVPPACRPVVHSCAVVG